MCSSKSTHFVGALRTAPLTDDIVRGDDAAVVRLHVEFDGHRVCGRRDSWHANRYMQKQNV